MKTIVAITLLGVAALAGLAQAAGDDAEPATSALTLTASNFAERAGATLDGDELQIAPTGTVACAVAFATNQVCTFVVVARAPAATQLAVRLDTHTIALAQLVSTNLASHSFSAATGAGTHRLVLAPEAASNAVCLASITLVGAPLPRLVVTNQVPRPAWDQPVGR
jgi:hypothetical protein